MEEQASQVTMDFAGKLIDLSRVIVEIFKTNNLDKLPEMNSIIKEMYRYIDSTVHLNVNDMFTAALKATRIEMSEAEKKQFMAQHIKTMQMSIAPDGEVVLSFKHK